jgi:filamentous hemagglutinin family protein
MNKRMRLTTLAGAIALAMGSTAVYAAAPAATQLPGQGKVALGTAPTVGAISAGSQTITLNSDTVIDWGVTSGATINTGTTAQPGGFNIGSSASLTFGGTGAVLNVDVSGNASQIFGKLNSTAGNLYVANANGIIVGAGAQITGSAAVGLIANTLADTSGFSGTVGPAGSVAYDGTGGDVTVAQGAGINGTTVLVSGGGTVNVDLGKIDNAANVFLTAGLPSDVGYDTTANNFTAPGFATINPNAALNVTGTLPSGSAFGAASSLLSGGDITISGTVDVTNAPGGATAGGTLTNNGDLTWGLGGSSTAGDVVNNGTISLTGTPDIGGVLTNYGQITGAGHVILAHGVDNVGSIDVNIIQSKGDFTNSGEVKVTTAGGGYPAAITVIGGDLSNSGDLTSGSGVSVTGGDFTNQGTMTLGSFNGPDGYIDSVFVTNGSIVNQGTLVVTSAAYITTGSDASDPSFTEGGDYSITNTGTITSTSGLGIAANDQYEQADSTGSYGNLNGTTGSFTNTGSLQVAPLGGVVGDNSLDIYANNDINLGGVVQTNDGAGHVKALSASNPLYGLYLSAGSYDYSSAFTSDGVASVTTDITTSEMGSVIAGSQVRLMSNLTAVDSTSGAISYTSIVAGATPDEGYAVRVAAGKTVTADHILVDGDQAGDAPNVILQGTLAGNQISFGEGYAVGDIFSGPNGGFQLWSDGSADAYLGFTSTGRIKTAPYLNDANNFRYNYLPIDVVDGSTLHLEIDPSDMQGTPTSGLNLLVNSDVTLDSDLTAALAGAPGAGGTAVTGVNVVPNSHLVLQSTGNIETSFYNTDFYWPGYIYLGNIAMDADGNALPGTLGLGTITTMGEFNNALPGDIAGASGIHFITQFPMTIGGNVITNANAWVNFGTALLTEAYSSGTLPGNFYGGTQGAGSVVNYDSLDPSNFVTQPPVSEK